MLVLSSWSTNPAANRREPRKPHAAHPAKSHAKGDRLTLSAGQGQAREHLSARLLTSYNALSWKEASSDKLRILSALGQTRTDEAADTIKKAYSEMVGSLTPMGQEALALRFRSLVELPATPGLEPLSAAKRKELIAFIAKEYQDTTRPQHVHSALGVSLALSQSEEGSDALIKEYKSLAADRRVGVLTLMSACPTEKLALFLTDEFDRLTNADAKRDVMMTLQEILQNPLR